MEQAQKKIVFGPIKKLKEDSNDKSNVRKDVYKKSQETVLLNTVIPEEQRKPIYFFQEKTSTLANIMTTTHTIATHTTNRSDHTNKKEYKNFYEAENSLKSLVREGQLETLKKKQFTQAYLTIRKKYAELERKQAQALKA